MPNVSSKIVAGNQAWSEQEVEKSYNCFYFRAHLPPFLLPSLPSSLTLSPFGTFNGIKLWACKSDNNCLGLKHNTLTGLTRPFSPSPLVFRCGHLLVLWKKQPQRQATVVRRHFLCHYPLTRWLLLLSYWHTEENIKESKSISRVVSCYSYINAHWSLGGCEHLESSSLRTDITYFGVSGEYYTITFSKEKRKGHFTSHYCQLLCNCIFYPLLGFLITTVKFFSCLATYLSKKHIYHWIRIDYLTERTTVLKT